MLVICKPDVGSKLFEVVRPISWRLHRLSSRSIGQCIEQFHIDIFFLLLI